jgi:hypothetical protein
VATEIADYISVAVRAAELGCPMPAGIAILPDNFKTATSRNDLLFRAEASTIRKLLRSKNVAVDNFLEPSERAPSIHNKHFEWAPLLFVSAAALSNDPNLITVALGVIANYATDFFKGMPSKRVKLSIVVERKADRNCKRLDYEGDLAGLTSLPDIVRSLSDEQ